MPGWIPPNLPPEDLEKALKIQLIAIGIIWLTLVLSIPALLIIIL